MPEIDDDEVVERVRARRDLHQLAHTVVLATHRPDDLDTALLRLNPRAARALPSRELESLATLVARPHRG